MTRGTSRAPLWIAAAAVIGLLGGCGEPPAVVDEGDSEGGCAAQVCGDSAYCDEVSLACFCEPGSFGDPAGGCVAHGDLCGEAAERVGHDVCRHELADESAWNATSIASGERLDVRRLSKFLTPANPNSPLPTLFSNTNFYRLHRCMLREGFEPLFPMFDQDAYNDLVYWRSTRSMYAGSIYELSGDDLPAPYAFLVETPDAAPQLLEEHEVYAVYRALSDRFGPGELAYLPYTEAMVERAATWTDAPFAIIVEGSDAISFESYASGATYGRIRGYSASEVGTASGTFGWQDILVLETSTNDLEGVNAGVITGVRQDTLSHLNVLAGQRGTPNAYVADALAAFAPYEGKLVRLDISEEMYTIAEATLEEAEAFWAEHRPFATIDRPPDAEYTELVGLLEIPTATAEERADARARVGGKATGLATLYPLLDPIYQVRGFGIPVAHYLDFMASNSWTAAVGDGEETLTYAETITAWLGDEVFRSDTKVRRERLEALVDHVRDHGVVKAALVDALRARITDEFGDGVMVRFRSSSNAEDGVEFNGAGLYESTNACVADLLEVGKSACDPSSNSRTIERALLKVWASLWSFGAYEEREFFQLDHSQAAMGILVSDRFGDERANGVAFTGNPTDAGDPRFTVNVQLGEVDVVGAPAGTVAELDRLRVEGGEVVAIDRVSPSSLSPETPVMSDAELTTLGTVLAEIAESYPVELGEHDPADVLLDLEFKIDAAGELKIKQIRPFLRSAVDPAFASCPLQ
ncbi:MAG: PEP/pyruvate-binding domain-containing protein [Nannocystaceae bacterium]